MTNPGLLAYVLPLIGIRSAFAVHEVMETIEVFRALGNCYRLACSEAGSSVSYARLTLDFVKTTIVSAYPELRSEVATRHYGMIHAVPVDPPREVHRRPAGSRRAARSIW
jgi:hypothetical protein